MLRLGSGVSPRFPKYCILYFLSVASCCQREGPQRVENFNHNYPFTLCRNTYIDAYTDFFENAQLSNETNGFQKLCLHKLWYCPVITMNFNNFNTKCCTLLTNTILILILIAILILILIPALMLIIILILMTLTLHLVPESN